MKDAPDFWRPALDDGLRALEREISNANQPLRLKKRNGHPQVFVTSSE
jgi:hypothetical protein